MDDKQLEKLLEIVSTDALLIFKRDSLTALIDKEITEENYRAIEIKLNAEIHRRSKGK